MLSKQFLIRRAGPTFPDAKHHALGDLELVVADDLSCVPVYRDDQPVGWLLGDAVDSDARTVVSGIYRRLSSGPYQADAWVEEHVYRLSGSFLFVLNDGDDRRLYLDSCGTLSAVYDPGERKAGATALAVLGEDAYRARRDLERYDAYSVHGDGWFSGGLTAHTGLERLLANHYLDLDSFEAKRHWPVRPLAFDLTAETTARNVAKHVQDFLTAMIGDRPLYVGLTGGNESRALLAACRDIRDKLIFVTVDAPGSLIDRTLVNRLVRTFGLRHRFIPYVTASQEQQDRWEMLAGHSLSGMNKRMHPSVWPLSDGIFVGGLGGEIGRGFLWRNAEETAVPSAINLLDRLKLPRDSLLLERVTAWQQALPPGLPALQVLDLAYTELRMSAWAFSQAYANPKVTDVHPLISRSCIEQMLRTAPAERASDNLFKEIVRQQWPELLTIPVNKFGDIRDQLIPLYKMVLRPDRAIRKARQILRSAKR